MSDETTVVSLYENLLLREGIESPPCVKSSIFFLSVIVVEVAHISSPAGLAEVWHGPEWIYWIQWAEGNTQFVKVCNKVNKWRIIWSTAEVSNSVQFGHEIRPISISFEWTGEQHSALCAVVEPGNKCLLHWNHSSFTDYNQTLFRIL